MSALTDFVAQTENQCIDLDNFAGCQCVDLAQYWALKCGHPFPLVVGAKDFAGKLIDGWSWIQNSPTNFPQAGDIVIWNSLIGLYGHVDVCLSGDASGFVGLDQNWFNSSSMGSRAARVTHNYYGVAGWFRLNAAPSGGTPQMPQTPFFVKTHGDAQWYGAGFSSDPRGSAANLSTLKIVEVSSQPDHFYYRWDGGAWWLKDVDTDQVAAPAALVAPPANDLEARVARLERIFNGFEAAIDG